MAEASPTGTPVIPPRYVPLLALLGAVLVPVAVELQDPAPWDIAKVGKLLGLIVPAVLGILSPGYRRPDGGPSAPLAKALGAAGSVSSGGDSALSRTWGMRMLERSRLL